MRFCIKYSYCDMLANSLTSLNISVMGLKFLVLWPHTCANSRLRRQTTFENIIKKLLKYLDNVPLTFWQKYMLLSVCDNGQTILSLDFSLFYTPPLKWRKGM